MHLRFFALLGFIAMGSAACGFHMRGAGLDSTESFYVEGIAYSDPLVADLTQITSTAGGQISSSLAKASAIIHIHKATYSRRGMSLSQFGQTTMYELSYRVVYDIREKSGEILIPQRDLDVVRQYYNSQTMPLAQAQEEGVMQQEMRMEAAQSLLRQTINAVERTKLQPQQKEQQQQQPQPQPQPQKQ
jgi:LPS-assembly lipoprotein